MAFDPMDDKAEPPDSYWEATAPPLGPLSALAGDTKADVAVVGGGFTGLSAALHVAERGRDVVVLEANQPGWGASGRNNGQVVAALKHEPHEIEERFGLERGGRLIQIVGDGPELVFSLIARHAIDCAARRGGIITAAHSRASLEALRKRTELWVARGAPLRLLSREETHALSGTDFYFGACLDPRGGGINPLAYARGLARAAMAHGARVVAGARVATLAPDGAGWRLRLANGVAVAAGKVVIATNAHTGDFWPRLKRTFIPARTPQVVSRPLAPDERAAILPEGQIMSDTRNLTLGVRLHPDGRLHLGGGGGTSGADRPGPYDNLRRQAHVLFPHLGALSWDYAWSGFMAMTPDRYPRLYDLAPGLAAVLGYSGRGLATATLMGRELADWAVGRTPIDQLALPCSPFKTLPYHFARTLVGEAAIAFYGAKDRYWRR